MIGIRTRVYNWSASNFGFAYFSPCCPQWPWNMLSWTIGALGTFNYQTPNIKFYLSPNNKPNLHTCKYSNLLFSTSIGDLQCRSIELRWYPIYALFSNVLFPTKFMTNCRSLHMLLLKIYIIFSRQLPIQIQLTTSFTTIY